FRSKPTNPRLASSPAASAYAQPRCRCEAGSSHPPTDQDASPSVLPCLVVVLAIRSPSQTPEQPARNSALVLPGSDALCRTVRYRLSAPRPVVVLVLRLVPRPVHQFGELVDRALCSHTFAARLARRLELDVPPNKLLFLCVRELLEGGVDVDRDRVHLGGLLP